MSGQSSPTETSVVVAVWHAVRSAASKTGASRVMALFQQITGFLRRAVQSSGLARLGTHVARWTRNSFLFRWLTAEPTPEIIVIDLRETYTVGPILALLERIFDTLGTAWQAASVGAVTDSVHDALREHPVRTLSLVAVAAILTSLALSAVFGSLGTTGLGLHLIGGALATLGTRIRVSWEQCTESATYRYLVAALEPPEPPEAEDGAGR